MFRGREISLTGLGMELLNKIVKEAADVAVVEQSAKFEGRTMMMILAPKPL